MEVAGVCVSKHVFIFVGLYLVPSMRNSMSIRLLKSICVSVAVCESSVLARARACVLICAHACVCVASGCDRLLKGGN